MLRNAEFKQPETVRVTLSAPDLVSFLEGGDHDRVDRRTSQRFEPRIPCPRVCSRARWGRRRRSGSSAGKHRVGPPRNARRDPRERGRKGPPTLPWCLKVGGPFRYGCWWFPEFRFSLLHSTELTYRIGEKLVLYK